MRQMQIIHYQHDNRGLTEILDPGVDLQQQHDEYHVGVECFLDGNACQVCQDILTQEIPQEMSQEMSQEPHCVVRYLEGPFVFR